VAAECIAAEKNEIRQQNECTDADAEVAAKPERFPNVMPQNDQKDERKIQEIAVYVLQD
jgi:hypothetical protein